MHFSIHGFFKLSKLLKYSCLQFIIEIKFIPQLTSELFGVAHIRFIKSFFFVKKFDKKIVLLISFS